MVEKEDLQKLRPGADFDALGAFSKAVRDVVNLSQVARLALDNLSHHFRGADLALSLSTSRDQNLLPLWVAGDQDLSVRFRQQEGPLWDATLQAYNGDQPPSSSSFYTRQIMVDDVVIGVMVLRDGDEQMVGLVDFVTDELAQVAVQLDEIAEVQQLSRELAILNKIGKSLTAHLELESILVATMQGIWELFDVEVAFLTLLDFDRDDRLSWFGDRFHLFELQHLL